MCAEKLRLLNLKKESTLVSANTSALHEIPSTTPTPPNNSDNNEMPNSSANEVNTAYQTRPNESSSNYNHEDTNNNYNNSNNNAGLGTLKIYFLILFNKSPTTNCFMWLKNDYYYSNQPKI